MDYEEFLWACGLEFEASAIASHFAKREGFDQATHRSLMKNFRTYMAVGGMPKVVDTYLTTRDFYAVDREKKNILKLYEDDLIKIDRKYGTICYLVWKQMPVMLSKHSTRFIVSSTNQRADSVLFASTIEKLIESKMVIAVYRCTDPTGGFALTKDLGAFKLYFNDTGLFTSIVFPSTKNDGGDIYQRLILDKLKTNLGMLFENVAAQTLVANAFEPFYYSWSQEAGGETKKYEIDFLVFMRGKTTPFEVKSRAVSNKESLERFRERFAQKVGEKYIVDIKPLRFGDNLTYLPYYMLFSAR
jgi:predicted AAA+ superfamily ATPase